MKNTPKFWYVAIFLMTTLSCTKSADLSFADSFNEPKTEQTVSTDGAQPNISVIGNPYSIILESVTNNGDNTWTWIWSVQNQRPGSGSNGSAQDLSNWGFGFGSCVSASNLVSAGYSANGSTWTDFTPQIAVDPSQTCFTRPALKFEFETTGNQKSWYRVVVNKDLPVNNAATGYYKSGTRTGCGTFTFSGIGCGDIIIEIIE
jgi:hypothetical protein